MNNSFLIFILSAVLASLSARAETIHGRLLDADTREPVAGAVIKCVGGKGFTSSSADGRFKLECNAAKISIRSMGYKSIELPLPLGSEEILLQPKQTVLNEVVVSAPDIFQRGDTLVFNAGKYATAADDAIIDVIKRLPGVKVEKDGTIMYQGKPINKFYIDGNDFVGDAYGLATNNISKDDVAAVEVMENHQPVKALEDIEFSDQAGINLKLKEDARSRWAGVTNAGAGASPALFSGSAFAMRLARKMQNMFTIKADNTGWNPENEIKEMNYDPMFSSEYRESLWTDYISADMAVSPLAENRTRDNLSWLANAIASWGKGDVSNRLKLNYIGDRLDYNSSAVTDYFDSGIPDFIRHEDMRTRRHSFSAELKTEVNSKSYFLKDNLSLGGEWNKSRSGVTGSYILNQDVTRRRLYATNDLRIIKKTEKKIFTFASRNSFTHNPSSLDVAADYGSPSQRFNINDFRSTTESQYGWFKGFWRIYADGGVDFNYRHINASLERFPIEMDKQGVYDAILFSAYISPRAEYERRGWRFVVRMPLQWHYYSLRGNHNFLTFKPSFYAKRQLSAKSDISLWASYSSFAPDAPMFVDCAVLTDYHNIFNSVPVEKNTSMASASCTYRYRNPLSALFANATVGYTYTRFPYMSNQIFDGDFIYTTYRALRNGARNLSASGGISKGLCHSRLIPGIEASYSKVSSATMRDSEKLNFRQQVITLKPYLKGSICRWLSMNYALNLSLSSLKIDRQSATDASSMNQTLSVTFIPADELTFTLGGEHYYTHFGDGATRDANLVLLDVSATWQITSKIRLSLTARNLLDKNEYRYTSFGTLSQTDASFRIRPRNILASFQLRF